MADKSYKEGAFTEEQLHVLNRIQDNVPKELTDKLMKKEYALPETRELVRRALADKDAPISAEKREQLQAVWNTGYFDQTFEVADPKIEKKLDEYYTEAIKSAQDRGELPREPIRSIRKKHQHERTKGRSTTKRKKGGRKNNY